MSTYSTQVVFTYSRYLFLFVTDLTNVYDCFEYSGQPKERNSHAKSPVIVGCSGGGGGGTSFIIKATNEEKSLSAPPTKQRQRMRTSSMPVENRKVSTFPYIPLHRTQLL